MKKLPCWIPYPSSWARSAVTFCFYVIGPIFIGAVLLKSGMTPDFSVSIWDATKRMLLFTFLPALIFAPGLCIAYIHHWMVGKGNWLIPGIISVWEGVYSFQAAILSITFLLSLLYYLSGEFLVPMVISSSWLSDSEIWEVMIPLSLYILLAYVYQIEYVARRAINQRKKATQSTLKSPAV